MLIFFVWIQLAPVILGRPVLAAAASPGVFDQFNLYTPIPYVFGDNVDGARKVLVRCVYRSVGSIGETWRKQIFSRKAKRETQKGRFLGKL